MTDWREETVRKTVRRWIVETPVTMKDLGVVERVAARQWWQDHTPNGLSAVRVGDVFDGLPDDALFYEPGDDEIIITYEFQEKTAEKKVPPQRTSD